MADYLTNDTELTSIANAIRSKSGSSGTMEFPDGFVSAIGNIPTGGGSSSNKTVVFFDGLANNGEGGVVTSYTPEEFAALSAMPANPDHSTYSTHGISIPMTSQGWNWSLAGAKAYVAKYGTLTIGQMYVPTDGKTHYICYVPEDAPPERWNTNVGFDVVGANKYLYWQVDNGEVNVDTDTAYILNINFSTTGWHDVKFYSEDGVNYFPKGTGSNPTSMYKGKFQKIQEAYFGKDVNKIGSYGLTYYCSLKIVTIPNSVTIFENYAMGRCNSLVSITIPINNTEISDYSFSSCYSISVICISEALTKIGTSGLCYCRSLLSFNLPDNLVALNDLAFSYCGSLETITIPDGITTIGASAFSYCYSLKIVHMTNSITIIKSSAFRSCVSLHSIELSNNIETIEGYAFYECYSLKSINLSSKITSIANYVFYNCYSLFDIVIPANVTTIGEKAFNSCSALDSINIPDSVTSIGLQAFYNCNSISSIILPANITAINDGTFYACYSLTAINLPASVSSINATAFQNCHSLKNIVINSSTPPTLSNVLANLMTDYAIIVPQGSLSVYTSATNWSDYASHIVEAT